jgi:hypothetical protein
VSVPCAHMTITSTLSRPVLPHCLLPARRWPETHAWLVAHLCCTAWQGESSQYSLGSKHCFSKQLVSPVMCIVIGLKMYTKPGMSRGMQDVLACIKQ